MDLYSSEVVFINNHLKSESEKLGGLLYQGSKDGFSPSNFHDRCNSKGANVVIIETTSGTVFGGYTDQSWGSRGSYVSSSPTFLFRLRPSMNRYDLQDNRQQNALYDHLSYGPTFGSGHDIYVRDGCNYRSVCSTSRSSYNMPTTYELNDGERYF